MDKERKENLFCYLKIFGGLLMIFPLSHAFFALDLGLIKGGIIAGTIHLALFTMSIPMFNYLQYGKFRFNVTYNYGRKRNKNI